MNINPATQTNLPNGHKRTLAWQTALEFDSLYDVMSWALSDP